MAFRSIYNLNSIIIPETVTIIENDAFAYSYYLTRIVIPNSVTSFGTGMFSECSRIVYNEYNNAKFLGSDDNPYLVLCRVDTSVTEFSIPSTTRFIEENAFDGCLQLTSVNIPEGVKSIGYGAFARCINLENLTIPDTVEYIGQHAFERCSKITSITIPNGITSIENQCFNGCSSLVSITIPDSVTSISSMAFCNCRNLTSITIHDNISEIGSQAFDSTGYYNATSNWEDGALYLGKYLIAIDSSMEGEYAIKPDTRVIAGSVFRKSNLTKVTIPDSVVSIGDYAFYGCADIAFALPSSLMRIERYAFVNCRTLSTITLSEKLTSVGENAFDGCSGLTEVHYANDLASWCSISFANKSSNPLSYAKKLYLTDSTGEYELVGELVVPDDVTEIGAYAFSGYTGLTGVTIPNSVVTIGASAFENCTNLSNITLPNTIIQFDKDMFSDSAIFRGCTSISEVTLPIGMTEIPSSMFYGCSNLERVIIPEGVVIIGDSAFENCGKLTSIVLPSSVTTSRTFAFYGTGITDIYINRPEGTVAFEGMAPYPYNATIHWNSTGPEEDPDIPDEPILPASEGLEYELNEDGVSYSVIGIGTCTDTDVVIPATYEGLPVTALKPRITWVESKGSMYEESAGTFENCSNLTSIIIPDSVTNIGERAFLGCAGLTSITIPDSVTSIGESAFSGCNSLLYNEYDNGKYLGNSSNPYTVLCDVDTTVIVFSIPTVTKIILYGAFSNCSSLTDLTIPDSVTSIGYGAFRDCTGLTSITIPDSVTNIGGRAFQDCTGLTSVTIPDSVTSIGPTQFAGCSSLPRVNIGNNVTSIGDYAFYNCRALTDIVFEGTMEQWNNISKGTYWDYNVPATYVQCTDGRVTI